MSESHTIQTVTDVTVSRFSLDTLINPHDAYMYNYTITITCEILHAHTHMLQVLLYNLL